MKTFSSVLAILFFLFLVTTFSQCAADKSYPTEGVFWKISGNGLKKPSYLLGTLHRGGAKAITDSIPSIIEKLESAELFCPELDVMSVKFEKPSERSYIPKNKSPLKPWPSDSTYADLLTDAQIKKLLATISSDYADNYLDLFRPIDLYRHIKEENNSKYWSIREIEDDSLREKTYSAYAYSVMTLDEMLIGMARNKKIHIVSLDTMTVQHLINDSINNILPETSYKQEVDLLMHYVENHEELDSLVATVEERILRNYLDQNLTFLCNYFEFFIPVFSSNPYNIKAETIKIIENLYIDYRNNLWMEKIPTLINEKSTFIAVGSAHLCGETGLIHQLRALGYNVERIEK